MSLVIVDRTQQKEKLDSILGAVNKASASKNCIESSFEERANIFLDSIIETKKMLRKYAEEIDAILSKIDEITWFRNVSDDLLIEIQEIVQCLEKLSNTMIRMYAENNKVFTSNGIDKEELRYFKEIACEVKEVAVDLNDIFFVLPHDERFQKHCKELNAL